MDPAALATVRVVEVGERVAIAYAGKLLAELGADVVKVEDVVGDPMRRAAQSGDLAAAGFYSYLNAAKRAVSVRSATPAGDRVVGRLRDWADIVLTDRRPEELPAADGPPVVRVHVTDYGLVGPRSGRPATGLTVQAAAGWVIWRGQVGDEPVQVGGEPEDLVAGRPDGSDVEVDLSVVDALHGAIPFHEVDGGPDPTMLDLAARPFPLTIMKAADGWVGLNCLTGQQWYDACALLDILEYAQRREELRADPVLLQELRVRVQPWFDARTVAEIVELAQAFRIPAAALDTAETILRSPHLRERGFFAANEVDGKAFEQPGPAYRLGATPVRAATGVPGLSADVDPVRPA